MRQFKLSFLDNSFRRRGEFTMARLLSLRAARDVRDTVRRPIAAVWSTTGFCGEVVLNELIDHKLILSTQIDLAIAHYI